MFCLQWKRTWKMYILLSVHTVPMIYVLRINKQIAWPMLAGWLADCRFHNVLYVYIVVYVFIFNVENEKHFRFSVTTTHQQTNEKSFSFYRSMWRRDRCIIHTYMYVVCYKYWIHTSSLIKNTELKAYAKRIFVILEQYCYSSFMWWCVCLSVSVCLLFAISVYTMLVLCVCTCSMQTWY